MKSIMIVCALAVGAIFLAQGLASYVLYGGAVGRGESATLTAPKVTTFSTTTPEVKGWLWNTPAQTTTTTATTQGMDRPGAGDMSALNTALLAVVVGGFLLLAALRGQDRLLALFSEDAAKAKAKVEEAKKKAEEAKAAAAAAAASASVELSRNTVNTQKEVVHAGA